MRKHKQALPIEEIWPAWRVVISESKSRRHIPTGQAYSQADLALVWPTLRFDEKRPKKVYWRLLPETFSTQAEAIAHVEITLGLMALENPALFLKETAVEFPCGCVLSLYRRKRKECKTLEKLLRQVELVARSCVHPNRTGKGYPPSFEVVGAAAIKAVQRHLADEKERWDKWLTIARE